MEEFVKNLYEEVAVGEDLHEDEHNLHHNSRRLIYTKRKLEVLLNRDSKILEVGPGSGYITSGILDLILINKIDYFALDISENFLAKTFNNYFSRENFFCADICDPKLAINEKFDLILFQEVLEHLAAPFLAMINLNNMLKPNGVLLLTTPNTYNVFSQFELMFKKTRYYPNTHIAEYSPLGLLKLMSMSGFLVSDLDFYNLKINSLPKFAGQLFSSEVGVVARKNSSPRAEWRKLTERILLEQQKGEID